MAQNIIKKTPLSSLGYDFISGDYLPEGENEYYLRNRQINNGIHYRRLNAYEIEVLVRNRNTSDDWNNILVSDAFNPELVKNCKFFGLVRIGKLEPFCVGFSDLRLPVGLYNSTIISCDFGDNVVIDNVNYLSHYIIGNDVIISNINEMINTNHSKFGNGIVKQGEKEEVRIWLELCNENTGRKIMPFNGMLAGDAYIWSKFKDDQVLQEKLKEFTENKFPSNRGYYGKVGDRSVIKNSKIIKDVWFGSDCYVKGANKLKNLTINSGEKGRTQIGEGVELVNGIIGYGCRIFYGSKAVRFIMSDNSQLKYGARLINSFLGDNATISCCEVLNSLIFPAHEQHHNNSFLCAAMVMGQSNIAAGATIGSNHNSRAADGEIIAGRGFWPGLCVSLKHNSKFASFTIVAKSDYQTELNIQLPFSLVSNDLSKDQLVVMPAYWFMYNMYALERNAWKYQDRDKRTEIVQHLDYHYLAPDTILEMQKGMQLLALFTGKAYWRSQQKKVADSEAVETGLKLLKANADVVKGLEVLADGFENSKRKVVIKKAYEAFHQYEDMIFLYGMEAFMSYLQSQSDFNQKTLQSAFNHLVNVGEWMNIGGQLIPTLHFENFRKDIYSGKISSWDQVHDFYLDESNKYAQLKQSHALACLLEITNVTQEQIDQHIVQTWLNRTLSIYERLTKSIYESRAKDYVSPFRKMTYDSNAEMNAVLGKLQDNSFILQQNELLAKTKANIQGILDKL